MGLLAADDLSPPELPTPPNLPPEWISTPTPSFVVGVGGTYALSVNTSDPESDPLTYTLNGGSTALPAGWSLASTGVITVTAAAAEATTTGILVDVSDGINTAVTSPSFSAVVSGAITAQELRDAGYILADDSAGVDPTGVSDSLAGLDLAFEAARNANKPLWLSEGATYSVSGSWRLGMWSAGDAWHIMGGGNGATRPLIKLIDASTGFTTGNEQPVVIARIFNTSQGGLAAPNWPANVMDSTGVNFSQSNVLFNSMLQNIRIDCGNNPGAFGLYFPAAQRCFAANIEIDASLAAGGIIGVLGRNSPMMNLKIIGGVFQIKHSTLSADGSAGVCIAGLTLVGDARTTAPITYNDTTPFVVVGFDITMATANSVITTITNGPTASNGMIFIDGAIRYTGSPATAIDNSIGRHIYLQNVFITGTNNLVQSGSEAIVNGTGTWKRIDEYCYSPQGTFDSASAGYFYDAVIDGVRNNTVEPVSVVTSVVGAPTENYVSTHTMPIHKIDDGPFVNILDHGAISGPNISISGAGHAFADSNDINTADSRAAFVAAFAAAKAAGHNRVFVPRGFFYVGSPGIFPDENTILIGTGDIFSKIGPHGTWVPTVQSWIQTTADSSTGTFHFSGIAIALKSKIGSGNNTAGFANDNFSWTKWRTGRFSTSVQASMPREFTTAAGATPPKTYHRFEGNAGGKHYGFTGQTGRFYGNINSRGVECLSISGPLLIYGNNPEFSKSGSPDAEYGVYIDNSSNIRVYGTKREGHSASIFVNNSTNIAYHGWGRFETPRGTINYILRVQGTSDDILLTSCVTDSPNLIIGGGSGWNTLEEDLAATPLIAVQYPVGVSIYKRGTTNEAAMKIVPVTPPSGIITGISFNMASVRNIAPGNSVQAEESDNWPITWASDGNQYTSFGDGEGFHNLVGQTTTRASIGWTRISGTQSNYSAQDTGKSGKLATATLNGKCYGILGANAKLYCAWDFRGGSGNDGSGSQNDRYHASTICSSVNDGATWTEEIRWDSGDWGTGAPAQLTGFYSPSFVQFGQNHAKPASAGSVAATDGFVYVLLCEHDDDIYNSQTPGGISLVRVLPANLESGIKTDWEYCSAIDVNNVPSWSATLTDRINIFQDAVDGNDAASMSYNEPLDRYILTTFHKQRAVPGSFIGIYDAPEPWGPWHTIVKEDVQTVGPNLATGNASLFWNFSNKWLSGDGLSFVMVGTLQGQDQWGTVEGTFTVG